MSEVTPVPPRWWKAWSQELAQAWRAMPSKGLFGLLLAAWVVFFQFLGNSTFGYFDTPSLFGWMRAAYHGADDRYGEYVPLVVLALFCWKRRELAAAPKQAWWPAMGLVAGGLALHVVGFMVQQPRISIVGFFAGLYGLTGLVWGKAWLRATFFPYFLFAFCVPLGTAAEFLTFPLRLLVTSLSVAISRGLLGIHVVRVGTQIFNAQGTFNFDVAPACSGIRSLTALVALTTIYGCMSFKSPWKQALMVVVAVPLAVVGNVVRITGVIITADAFGQHVGSLFHEGAGFVTFGVAMVCVMALGYWLREEPRRAPTTRSVS